MIGRSDAKGFFHLCWHCSSKGSRSGIGAAVPIGPVNVELARRALRHGFWSAFALGAGACSVDVIYATISSLGVLPIVTRFEAIRLPMGLVATAFLAFLGTMSLRGAREANRGHLLDSPKTGRNAENPATSARQSPAASYVTGLLMTGFNPFTLAFWFVVLPKWADTISAQPRHDLPIIVTGVFIATISWVCGFSGLLALAGRWRQPWWLTAADEAGGVLLLAMAGAVFLRSV